MSKEFTERKILTTAISTFSEKASALERAYGSDLPTRAATEWSLYKGAIIYFECKLNELNLKEGLYEHQDGNSVGQSNNQYLQFGEGSNRV